MPYRLNAITGELDLIADVSSIGGITQIDGDTGSATPTAGVVNIIGTSAQGISSSGSGDTLTFTIDDATTSQKGVLETSTDAESIAGSSSSVAVTPESLKAKLGDQTQYTVPYGNTDSGAIQWTSVGTDGQLVIAATGGAPAFASITSSDSTITISEGANTIDLVTGSSVAISFPTDSGTATPSSGALTIAGGTGIATSASGSTVTITSTSGGLAWSVITMAASASDGNGYFTNAGGSVTITLPASSSVGDTFEVSAMSAGGWSIAQNAGQTIRVGNTTSTTGAGGSVDSTAQGDWIQLVCNVADTDWIACVKQGAVSIT